MAMAEPSDVDRFRLTLSELLSHDNEIRAKAEAVYDEIPLMEKAFRLMNFLREEGIPIEEAELAAVLLRRLFHTNFEGIVSKLPPNGLQNIKDSLLEYIQKDDLNFSLRKKISDIIAELARSLIDEDGNNHWPEFMIFLFDAAKSHDLKLKEIALNMFAGVPVIFGNQNKYIDVIHDMLLQSLSDQASLEVQYAAVKATTSFLLVNEREIAVLRRFSDCLNLLLQFLALMTACQHDRAIDIFRYMIELADKCPQFFRSHIDTLFELCLKCMSTPGCAESSRHLSLEVLVTLSESAPVMIRRTSSRHTVSLMEVLFKMMTEIEEDPEWDFDEDDNDEESDSTNLVAEAALDRIACALGGKTILPVVLNSLPAMLNSTDWKGRYAGLMTISAVGEGCHKQMISLLPQIVDGVLPFLMDSHSRVRYAACNALGQMASDFAPNFQKKFSDRVVNSLLQLLGEASSPRVQAHAGAALVNFLEDCPKQILSPFLNSIADTLESVLNSKMNELVQKGSKLVLEQVVITIASLANTAEENFLHFYDKFMPMLKYIIQNAHQTELKVLRGKTIECISLIGLAVGKEKFLNDAGEVMDLLLKSQSEGPLREDDPQLTYMIAAWARMCQILGKGFEPYLPFVMEPVLKAAALKPEVALLDADDLRVIENDEGWEFVNLGEKHNFGIRTAGLEEKSTACQMLVCYARELKEAFGPYIEDTVKLMVSMFKFYFHDGVRSAAAEILPHLLEASKIRGESYLLDMWRYILRPLLQAIESEPESDVLCEMMGALAQCIEVLNAHCFSHEELHFLVNFINKKLTDHFQNSNDRAQQRNTEEYDEDLEETLEKEGDDDNYILSKISDVICTLFSNYKQDFFPYFDILLPQYIKLVDPSRPWADRQWALCVFADVIQYGGPACTRYQQYFLRPIIDSLRDESPDLRQTAAYCIGVLNQYGGPEFSKVCADAIPILIEMITADQSRSEDNIRATENAISAITKCLMYNSSLINMEEILPHWISWLPIWEDEEESKVIYGFLCSLLEAQNPVILGNEFCNLPRIVQIIAEAFFKEAIEASSDIGKRVVAVVKEIQNNQALFSMCIGVLTQEQQEALHAALTHP